MSVVTQTLRANDLAPPELTRAWPEGIDIGHEYIDAGDQRPPEAHFANLIAVLADEPPDTVVVALDGDDWLARPDALVHVARAHAAGAWVTWGSFVFADGRPGFAADLPPGADLRRIPWVATHLKTFRAGLFHRINPAHLKGPDGRWLEHARDLALMFPCIEMAGPERCRFIPEPLYVYNEHASTEWNATPAVLAAQARDVAYVRGLPPYERIEAL
jgi:hypothetical protein